MAVGDTITADRYNTLQTRIDDILGVGSSTSGYGQSLSSQQVSITDTVQAQDMTNLYNDMVNARTHQTGSEPTSIAVIAPGNVIGENTSDEPDGSLKGYTDFENLMTIIEDNKLNIDFATQSSTGVSQTSTKSNWNGVLDHVVTFTWPSSDARRHFFNTRGEIRTSAAISGGSGSKTEDWRTMLSNMGTIKLNYLETVSTGSGTGSSIGFYDLTSSYQTVFNKAGSGVYAENDYIVQARIATATTLDIRIYFRDDDTGDQTGLGPPVDENVDGTLTSTVGFLRASGPYVSIPEPSSSNTNLL